MSDQQPTVPALPAMPAQRYPLMDDPPLPWPSPSGAPVRRPRPRLASGYGAWDDQAVAWDDARYDFEGNPLAIPSEFTYRSGDGLEEVVLDVMVGVRGRFMTTVELYQDVVPLQAGWRYRGARHANRLLVLPTVLSGIYQRGSERLRQVARALDPMRGIGVLESFTRAHGLREIDAVYAGGLDAADEALPWGVIAPLTFECPDPFWQDRLEQRVELDTNLDGAWFGIDNSGDAEAWPVWQFSGGGQIAVIWHAWAGTNNTHLQVLRLYGQVNGVTIDTRPEHKSVTRGGQNVFHELVSLSRLAPFPPGQQTWIVQTEAAGHCVVTWQRRYLVP